jgi:hypothetical protein
MHRCGGPVYQTLRAERVLLILNQTIFLDAEGAIQSEWFDD